jgi:hypothetical protein
MIISKMNGWASTPYTHVAGPGFTTMTRSVKLN